MSIDKIPKANLKPSGNYPAWQLCIREAQSLRDEQAQAAERERIEAAREKDRRRRSVAFHDLEDLLKFLVVEGVTLTNTATPEGESPDPDFIPHATADRIRIYAPVAAKWAPILNNDGTINAFDDSGNHTDAYQRWLGERELLTANFKVELLPPDGESEWDAALDHMEWGANLTQVVIGIPSVKARSSMFSSQDITGNALRAAFADAIDQLWADEHKMLTEYRAYREREEAQAARLRDEWQSDSPPTWYNANTYKVAGNNGFTPQPVPAGMVESAAVEAVVYKVVSSIALILDKDGNSTLTDINVAIQTLHDVLNDQGYRVVKTIDIHDLINRLKADEMTWDIMQRQAKAGHWQDMVGDLLHDANHVGVDQITGVARPFDEVQS